MMNLRLLIITIVVLVVVGISEYITYSVLQTAGIIKSGRMEMTLAILGVVLPIIFIATMIYSYKNYSLFNSWINVISAMWLVIILFVFMSSVIIALLLALNSYLNLKIPIEIISYILMVIVLCVSSYGVWNASNIKITRYTVKSESLSKDWAGKKIVIFSDLHIGNIRNEKFVKEIVDKINNEKPDVTFLLGDLIDGSSFPYAEWFSPFNELHSRFGNIYIEGNHERYSQEYDLFRSNFPANLNDLTDKKIIINNTEIIGLSYRDQESGSKTISRLNALGFDPQIPNIILIHNPQNTPDLAQAGASMVLSGHTHDGQFFPFTVLIKQMYKNYAYGISYTGKTVAVTSSGVGTFMVPLRVGTNSEIVVLTIE